MAYTYDPTTDRGKVRLLLYDNQGTDGDLTTYVLSDADVDALLELNSDSIWYAAAEGARVFAAKYTPSAYKLAIPGAIDLDKREVSKLYMSMAERFQARAEGSADGIVEFIDSADVDVDVMGNDNTEYVGD